MYPYTYVYVLNLLTHVLILLMHMCLAHLHACLSPPSQALCSNNEITFYFSMYLREIHSSGTVLEISSGQGARLPVFGVYFNAGADEIMFTYRYCRSHDMASGLVVVNDIT